MRRVVLALASIVVIGATPALAQYAPPQYAPPRPPVPIGPMAAADVAEIVQAMGLDPVGPPERSGAFYVQRAMDDFGRVLRVTVDPRRSQVLAVEAAAMLRQPYGHLAGRASYRRPYPGYAIVPDDDFDLAPPGSVLASPGHVPRLPPPHLIAPQPHAQPQRPATRSAAVPPARTPVPRKRPAAAPAQAAAGSVEPMSAASPPAPPQPAPPQAAPHAPPPAAAPAKPAEPAMAPVTPLE
jgi:hypothetical protein